jgi:hypothetical protein
MIVMNQAARASKAMSAVLDGVGDRETASDELRTYALMLLIAAPVMIDARMSRNFLEDAQRLAGELARTLVTTLAPPDTKTTSRSEPGGVSA